MTRIDRTRNRFEITARRSGRRSFDEVEFRLENDDGTMRLYANGLELNVKQLRKLRWWLGDAERPLSGTRGM